MMASLVPDALTTLVPRPQDRALAAPKQLDLVLDDTRLHGMTPTERQVVIRSLAHLLLEVGGVALREVGDDKA
jgi:hypothetical protein